MGQKYRRRCQTLITCVPGGTELRYYLVFINSDTRGWRCSSRVCNRQPMYSCNLYTCVSVAMKCTQVAISSEREKHLRIEHLCEEIIHLLFEAHGIKAINQLKVSPH